MAHSPHLRSTQRSVVEDLGLPAAHASRDARAYCADHEALRAFVTKRAGAPGDGEPVKDVGRFPTVLSLHVGRGRGATFYDETEDVCWFLAFKETHATHELRDAYQHFMALSSSDRLYPTADDYETIWTLSAEAQVDEIISIGAGIYEEARSTPNEEVNRTVTLGSGPSGEVMVVIDVQVIDQADVEEGWIVFTFPPDTAVSESQLFDVLDAILPERINLATLELAYAVKGSAIRYDQIAWTWSCYPE